MTDIHPCRASPAPVDPPQAVSAERLGHGREDRQGRPTLSSRRPHTAPAAACGRGIA